MVTRFYEGDSVWSVHAEDGMLLGRTVQDRAYDVYDRTEDGFVVASYRDPTTDERIAVLLEVTIGGLP